jgi:hypothetical protein
VTVNAAGAPRKRPLSAGAAAKKLKDIKIMLENEFYNWLLGRFENDNGEAASSRKSDCLRVEKFEGNLDKHYRPVCASPPLGGSASGFARSFAPQLRVGTRVNFVDDIPTRNLRHSLSALDFAAQSPYSGRQNVIYSQHVMSNAR